MANDQRAAEAPHHHLRQMRGRDPNEKHRVSSPLEVLFDLIFATAFGLASEQLAEAIGSGHYAAGLIGLAFAAFAICWAWISFSWFASAFDTDDWMFRIATMVQMIGVMMVAVGLPRLFATIEQGIHPDGTIMIMGYVVMRVASVSQWLRAAAQDPPRRRVGRLYAGSITLAQIGWVATIFMNLSLAGFVGVGLVLIVVEFLGPILAERTDGGTPWHPHHMAERYGLFFAIALGEAVVGTVATLAAVVNEQGWTVDAILVSLSGMGLTFGLWWLYYLLPSGEVLQAHRRRAFTWAYLQLAIVVAVFTTGAGLHVAAAFLEHKAEIGVLPVLLSTAIPVIVFLAAIYAIYGYLVRRLDRPVVWLAIASAIVVGVAILAAALGVELAVCLIILTLAPAVSVIGYEVWGHRSVAQALAKET